MFNWLQFLGSQIKDQSSKESDLKFRLPITYNWRMGDWAATQSANTVDITEKTKTFEFKIRRPKSCISHETDDVGQP